MASPSSAHALEELDTDDRFELLDVVDTLEDTDKRFVCKELLDACVQCESHCEELELRDEEEDTTDEHESTDAVDIPVIRRDDERRLGLREGLVCRLDGGLGLESEPSEMSVEHVDTDTPRNASNIEGDSSNIMSSGSACFDEFDGCIFCTLLLLLRRKESKRIVFSSTPNDKI